ncbi:M16 family metallopeptidase [Neorickettsia sennetsu]|uniref:Peptidase, M16 family n=1 Tax=Ehrlichia sennetsu (strain ATCC VR-367 / Miyayama) TaxID=222891 RepID=Q2GEM6_EHRS3|nr:pitrilysin family protein [Neorickettsia sennetsu]ABD45630.1 peptidase, M16 family [Neorickettsia sennetsu str. Miyayama]
MQNLVQRRLGNNLPVFVDSISGHYSVSIKVWVRAGSECETQENGGLAHFLEHMIFKGTSTRNAAQIAEDFDRLGGYFNACTSRGYTVYYVRLLEEHLDKGMEILSDVINNSIFPEEELEREKLVVLEEISQTEDAPDDIIFDRFFESIYPNQAYGRPILGSRENVKRFTRNDIASFISQHYYSENMMLIASGKVDAERFISLAEKYFGGIKSISRRAANRLPAKYVPVEYREERKLEQTHIILGLPCVSYSDGISQVYSAKVLAILFGGGMSSRLFQEVREKRGLAYSISAFHAPSETSAIMGVYSSTDPKRLKELVAVVLGELAKLRNTLTIEEVESAKQQIKSSILMSLESNESRASHIGRSIHYFGRYIDGAELIEVIDAVEVDDVASITEFMLRGKRLSLALIGAKDVLDERGVLAEAL